jgi:hypothetical protein
MAEQIGRSFLFMIRAIFRDIDFIELFFDDVVYDSGFSFEVVVAECL